MDKISINNFVFIQKEDGKNDFEESFLNDLTLDLKCINLFFNNKPLFKEKILLKINELNTLLKEYNYIINIDGPIGIGKSYHLNLLKNRNESKNFLIIQEPKKLWNLYKIKFIENNMPNLNIFDKVFHLAYSYSGDEVKIITSLYGFICYVNYLCDILRKNNEKKTIVIERFPLISAFYFFPDELKLLIQDEFNVDLFEKMYKKSFSFINFFYLNEFDKNDILLEKCLTNINNSRSKSKESEFNTINFQKKFFYKIWIFYRNHLPKTFKQKQIIFFDQ